MAETDLPKGYLPTPAIHPETNRTGQAYISQEKVRRYQQYGPAHKFHEVVHLVRSVLSDPDSIHQYVGEDWSGFCYARLCDWRYDNHGNKLKPPDGMTFLVFVGDDMKVVEWRWESCDAQNSAMPDDREGRLGNLIWSR